MQQTTNAIQLMVGWFFRITTRISDYNIIEILPVKMFRNSI
jgi:hypothetical protein